MYKHLSGLDDSGPAPIHIDWHGGCKEQLNSALVFFMKYITGNIFIMNENMTQTYKHRILYYIHNCLALLSKATSICQWCKYVTHIMHSMSVTTQKSLSTSLFL